MKSNYKYYVFLCLVLVGILVTFIIVKKRKSHDEASLPEISKETIKDFLDELHHSDVSGIEKGSDLFNCYIDGDKYPKTAFFADMIEAYNAYVLFHGISSVLDVWYRYEEPDLAVTSLQCADIEKLHYADIKSMISQALEFGQEVLKTTPMESDTIALYRFYNQLDVIDSTLANRFNVANYITLDEDEYWEVINSFRKQTGQSIDHIKAINESDDFEIMSEHAMAYVYDVGFYKTDFNELKKILEDGRYSPQLFFIWRIWRCGMQLNTYGPSTWSQIPNGYYNKMRLLVAESILNNIIKHPDDAIAINQYLVTAAKPNILRHGEFPGGNQSFMEVYYLGLDKEEKKIEN